MSQWRLLEIPTSDLKAPTKQMEVLAPPFQNDIQGEAKKQSSI